MCIASPGRRDVGARAAAARSGRASAASDARAEPADDRAPRRMRPPPRPASRRLRRRPSSDHTRGAVDGGRADRAGQRAQPSIGRRSVGDLAQGVARGRDHRRRQPARLRRGARAARQTAARRADGARRHPRHHARPHAARPGRHPHPARARARGQRSRGPPADEPDLPRSLVARYPRRPGTPVIKRLLASRAIGRNVTKEELEHRFLAFLDAQALPRPNTNREIWLRDGTWIKPDCHWPGANLIVELDGGATHHTRAAFENDRARDRRAVSSGHRVVRITWRQLHEDAAAIAAELRTLLGLRARP